MKRSCNSRRRSSEPAARHRFEKRTTIIAPFLLLVLAFNAAAHSASNLHFIRSFLSHYFSLLLLLLLAIFTCIVFSAVCWLEQRERSKR
jgi:fumarate reductase subunit D